MAKFVKCDRCGALVPGNRTAYKLELTCMIVPTTSSNLTDIDLCVPCANDLRAFMKNEDVARRYLIKEE